MRVNYIVIIFIFFDKLNIARRLNAESEKNLFANFNLSINL